MIVSTFLDELRFVGKAPQIASSRSCQGWLRKYLQERQSPWSRYKLDYCHHAMAGMVVALGIAMTLRD